MPNKQLFCWNQKNTISHERQKAHRKEITSKPRLFSFSFVFIFYFYFFLHQNIYLHYKSLLTKKEWGSDPFHKMELSLYSPPSIPTSSPAPLKRLVTFAVSLPNLTPAPPSHWPSLSSLKPNHLHRLKLKAMDSRRVAPPRASLAENNGSTLTDTPTPINSGKP